MIRYVKAEIAIEVKDHAGADRIDAIDDDNQLLSLTETALDNLSRSVPFFHDEEWLTFTAALIVHASFDEGE